VRYPHARWFVAGGIALLAAIGLLGVGLSRCRSARVAADAYVDAEAATATATAPPSVESSAPTVPPPPPPPPPPPIIDAGAVDAQIHDAGADGGRRNKKPKPKPKHH